jgi:hypothetical protein
MGIASWFLVVVACVSTGDPGRRIPPDGLLFRRFDGIR